MKGLKFLINELVSEKLTFYFKTIPVEYNNSGCITPVLYESEYDKLPHFYASISDVSPKYMFVQFTCGKEISTSLCSTKTTYNIFNTINCLCIKYEPEDIYQCVADFNRYLTNLAKKISEKMKIPVFLIYGYRVFTHDYFFMIRLINKDGATTIFGKNEQDYNAYLEMIVDIKLDDSYELFEFVSTNYDKDRKFYSIHKKEEKLC